MFWSQITDSSIVVSPALHNGLVLLHLFDYCVPPVKLDLLDSTKQHQQQQHHLQEKLIYSWLPASTAKIHVAGINSILVGFDDDKLEINTSQRLRADQRRQRKPHQDQILSSHESGGQISQQRDSI